MPEGQYSGERAIYVYKSDVGVEYLLTLDETLGGITECGLKKATKAQAESLTEAPRRLQPRYVLWQGKVGGRTVRKSLVCNPDSTAYQTASSQSFDIDGSTDGGTTGRVGEKLTFLKVKEVTSSAT